MTQICVLDYCDGSPPIWRMFGLRTSTIWIIHRPGGGADSGGSLQIQEHQSNIILIDVHLPHTMVLALTQQLTREFPPVHVLLLGVTEAETEIQAYVEAGAGGYVLKNTPFHELQSVIELVTRGETMCSPHIAHAMFARSIRACPDLRQQHDARAGDSVGS